VWSSAPPPGTPLLRIRGGDAFRYGDLETWVGWARKTPGSAVCIEGPAATLAGADRRTVVARIIAAQPDAVSAVLPTVAEGRTVALTGARWDPRRALEALQELHDAGLAVEVAFPVHSSTVGELPAVVSAVAEHTRGLQLTVRRCASGSHNGARRGSMADGSDWKELDALSAAIAALPAKIPGDTMLQFDPAAAYAACMFEPRARRRDLLMTPGQTGTRPLGASCDGCGWSRRCTFRADHGVPPLARIAPLTADEAFALDPSQSKPMTNEPRPFHTDRGLVGLPNLLCFAPWTTLSACEPRFHPVPCALSWVDTEMTPEQIAAETGAPIDDEREHERISLRELSGAWHVIDNQRLTLMDLWNSPLLRLMRREMTGGEKSSRCRAMCRVVMGVEERGIQYFQRPDAELTREVIANRERLREEIHAGKSVLTAKPLELMMGVSAHCNISCGFCDGPRGAWGDLSDRHRDEITAWLPSLMSFGVSGPGEPLMNRNFVALLQHISDVGYPSLIVSLTTNGTLLTPEFLDRNRNVPWGSVRMSVNAGSADTYERMTGKRYFDRMMRNLDALCDLRDRRDPPFSITLSFVIGSVQIGDLAKFAKIVDDHRTGIVVEPMYDNLRNLSPWILPDKLRVIADELESVADSYAERNPDITRALRAVEQFTRKRIASGDLAILKGH